MHNMPTPIESFSARDLEEAIISAIIGHPNIVSKIQPVLTEEVFSDSVLKGIYSDILLLNGHSKNNDLLKLLLNINKNDPEKIAFLKKLEQNNCKTDNTEFHIKIIIQKYILREIINLTSKYHDLVLEDKTDIIELIEMVKSDINSLEKCALSLKSNISL